VKDPTMDATTATQKLNGYFEEVAEHTRTVNDKLVADAKKASLTALELNQKTLSAYLTYRAKLAGITDLEWYQAVVKAQNEYVGELTTTYAAAARSTLN
jgi:hypothetical protein